MLQDRIVFHRLEQICYCVETGDWPFPAKMKNVHILGIDSSSTTPTRSLTPSLTPKLDDEPRPASADRASVSGSSASLERKAHEAAQREAAQQRDFEVHMAEVMVLWCGPL